MTTRKQLLTEIHSMKSELEESLVQAVKGGIVDISRLPDRLMVLYSEVQKLNEKHHSDLTTRLEELLDLLDNLSKEIHKKYEDISKQIKMLDG